MPPRLPPRLTNPILQSVLALSTMGLACNHDDPDDPTTDMGSYEDEVESGPGVGFIGDPDVGSSDSREDRPCNPIDQDCGTSLGCYWVEGEFLCVEDTSGDVLGALGDACEYANSCDPGLFCADGHLVTGCDTSACCSEICELDDSSSVSVCSDPDQECTPWWDDGQAPVGYESVGACVLRG